MALKRKSEFAFEKQCKTEDNKRCKRDMKKSTREQERVLLENFVKYGILPTSKFGRKENIQVRIPSPLSPLTTPVRPQSNLSSCAVAQKIPRTHDSGKSTKQSAKFWRPWVKSSKEVKQSECRIAGNEKKNDQEQLHYKKREIRKFCSPKQSPLSQEKTDRSKQVSPQMRIPAQAEKKTVLHYRPEQFNVDFRKRSKQQSWNPANSRVKSPISPQQRSYNYSREAPRSHPIHQSCSPLNGAQNQANYYLEAMNHIMAQQRHLANSRCVSVFN